MLSMRVDKKKSCPKQGAKRHYIHFYLNISTHLIWIHAHVAQRVERMVFSSSCFLQGPLAGLSGYSEFCIKTAKIVIIILFLHNASIIIQDDRKILLICWPEPKLLDVLPLVCTRCSADVRTRRNTRSMSDFHPGCESVKHCSRGGSWPRPLTAYLHIGREALALLLLLRPAETPPTKLHWREKSWSSP